MIKRFLVSQLKAALKDTPVVFLAGARQTGKSTLVQHILDETSLTRYITLDDYTVLNAAKSDPQGFIGGLPQGVIIDEVQRVPEIFLAIKEIVDRNKIPGQFLLTGSANILLLPKVADSLTGRLEIQTLWPFSQSELKNVASPFIDNLFGDKELPSAKAFEESDLWDAVVNGGYPEIVNRTEQDRKEAWFRNYITTLVQRDIRDIANIDGLTILPNLLQIAAARSAQLLNFADISRAIQIPQTSLKRYFSLLEAVYCVHRIAPWSSNFNTRLTKTPKVYCNDTGLLSFLLGIDLKRIQDDRTLAGHVFETFVVNELIKIISWSKINPRMFHFRTASDKEVDLILEDTRGRCIGIEVKASASLTNKDIAGLQYFRDLSKGKFLRGIIIYTGKEVIPFQKDIHAVPVSALWS